MIIDESPLFLAVQHCFARAGIVAPGSISLVSTDPDPVFDLLEPGVSHISWSSDPLVRRILRWADGIGRGENDRRPSYTRAKFIEGGTIGPAPH